VREIGQRGSKPACSRTGGESRTEYLNATGGREGRSWGVGGVSSGNPMDIRKQAGGEEKRKKTGKDSSFTRGQGEGPQIGSALGYLGVAPD